ncbi:hypothetical protein CR513_19382, partial [Mucuna pruriens]
MQTNIGHPKAASLTFVPLAFPYVRCGHPGLRASLQQWSSLGCKQSYHERRLEEAKRWWAKELYRTLNLSGPRNSSMKNYEHKEDSSLKGLGRDPLGRLADSATSKRKSP